MALMEVVMVLDGLARAYNALMELCRSCGGWGYNFFSPFMCSGDLRWVVVNMLTFS